MVYQVDIDFDAASTAWRSNKIYLGNGSYRYCENQTSSVIKSPPQPRYNLRHRPKTNRDSQCQSQKISDEKHFPYNLRSRSVKVT